jgi:hypothetical protein
MKGYRHAPTPSALQEYLSDLEVVEINGRKQLAKPSNDTASAVAYDYGKIVWQLQQIQNIKAEMQDAGKPYGLEEIRRDFAGKRVLDFADDSDLEAISRHEKVAPIAANMIARVTKLSANTVLQYAKKPRIDGKNQRGMVRRQLPKLSSPHK